MNRPEVHGIYRDWRGIADASDPPRVLVGETWIFDLREVARFYGATGDELNLCFNFPFVSPTCAADPAPDRGDDRGRARAVRPNGVGPARPTTSA
jgi:alpha-glucosidase